MTPLTTHGRELIAHLVNAAVDAGRLIVPSELAREIYDGCREQLGPDAEDLLLRGIQAHVKEVLRAQKQSLVRGDEQLGLPGVMVNGVVAWEQDDGTVAHKRTTACTIAEFRSATKLMQANTDRVVDRNAAHQEALSRFEWLSGGDDSRIVGDLL